jgi:predicted Zn-dependent protease
MSVSGTSLIPQALIEAIRRASSPVSRTILAITLLVMPAVAATHSPNVVSRSLVKASSAEFSREVGAVGEIFPLRFLDRLPKNMAVPAVARPRKKLDPKYDVSMIGHRDIAKGIDFYSLNKEIAIGRQMAQEVDDSVRLVKDPAVNEYINRLAQNLVRNSDAKVPFTVKIINDDQVNAFALPGGFFYINTGMILAANNEAELAAVMAHEIAHVAARHAMKNQSRADLFNLVSIPLMFFGGPAAMLAQEALQVAVPLSMLKFSRNDEREADLLGLEYAYATGYDPEEFVNLFEKLKKEEKQKKNFLARAFATHPMTSDRIRRAQKEIQKYLPPRREYIVDTSEFHQIKARVAMICNRSRIDQGKVNLPVLHRRGYEARHQSNGTGRPTLKRLPPPSASNP